MKKVVFVFAFAFSLFLISSVYALNVKETAISNIVVPEIEQPAKFTLEITGAGEGDYNIYTLTDVSIKPTSPFFLNTGVNSIEVYVYPTDNLNQEGFYSFNYVLKRSDGDSFENRMMIKIVKLENLLEVSSDENEAKAETLSFYVKNKENAEIKNLKARFVSKALGIDTERTFDLGANEKRTFSIPIGAEAGKQITAGSYIIKASFETTKGIKTLEGKVYVGIKKGIETTIDSNGFFVYDYEITKENVGNDPIAEPVSVVIKKDIISRLFTSFSVNPDKVERKGFVIYYTWNRELEHSDTFSVKSSTSYVYPLLILAGAVLIIWLFRKYTQTKVEITKSVSPVKTTGGHFALRVKLIVKAKEAVDKVSLIDRIPAIVQIYDKFSVVKPTKIDVKNRRIQWDVGSLNAGEERIFNYIVYSKVGVIGKFSLPEALGIFEKDGEMHEVESNQVFFLSEQVRTEED